MCDGTSGIVIGQVTNNEDTSGEGKIEVHFPWLGTSSPTRWCNVASAMAGPDRGLFFMPEVGDEVLVAFDHGDFDHGFIVGFTWNPVSAPPTTSPNERIIRSREGHTIRFLDAHPSGGNHGALVIEDAHSNTITMTNGVITVRSGGHLEINARTMRIMNRVVCPVGGEI